MEIIYKERGTGKSAELIKKSAQTGIYILVTNRDRALALSKQAESMGLHIPFPITVYEYMETKLRDSYIKDIMIDDADAVLQKIFYTVHIDTITISKGENE